MKRLIFLLICGLMMVGVSAALAAGQPADMPPVRPGEAMAGQPGSLPADTATATPTSPQATPTASPTATPTPPAATPTALPTASPTAKPTVAPTVPPTPAPEPTATQAPAQPTDTPAATPTAAPAATPTEAPTVKPSPQPAPPSDAQPVGTVLLVTGAYYDAAGGVVVTAKPTRVTLPAGAKSHEYILVEEPEATYSLRADAYLAVPAELPVYEVRLQQAQAEDFPLYLHEFIGRMDSVAFVQTPPSKGAGIGYREYSLLYSAALQQGEIASMTFLELPEDKPE